MPPIHDVDLSGHHTVLFGTYELGRLLGVGASAKVYQARNLRTGQYVAVKAVSKQKLLKGGHAALVKREIAIMRRLRHSHIVKLLEVLATKSKIYFVMEFAKGGELYTRVEKGRFCEDLCRRYFQQLISAVEYCHSRGVFHRDLKLENLLLDENLDLKVSDFGLSAVTEQVRPDGLLHTLCGTPAYVAPEILAKKGYDGAKVDVWSCGIILYVLHAGYLPFNDTNLIAMYKKIYRGHYRCPKWTSPDLKRFLSRLLDANPETRMTIHEIKRDPWFRKGYREAKIPVDDCDWKEHQGEAETAKHLSAFDIISFSPGFDLSGLFRDPEISLTRERFVSVETPESIIGKFEEAAREEKLVVTKSDDWVRKVVGRDGHVVLDVATYRLTEELVMVEIRIRGRNDGSGHNSWKDKLRPKLSNLIYQPETGNSGNRQ